jgi:para-nitrobenzyl esterase
LSGDADMTTVTNSAGYYELNPVIPGTYTVTMEPIYGYTRSISKSVAQESASAAVHDVDFVIETLTERTTSSGTVIGFSEDNGSYVWLGIPYAKAPVGDLRWKAPEPAESWEGKWLALEAGPVCIQISSLLVDIPGIDYGEPTGSEDCLFLNIWAPSDALAGDRLPVMVWIHGGGNSLGHGGSYSGRELADRYDVIVITFNYRLGPFGWFTHPALATGDAYDDSGNYGTLDIIRVLTWVQDNIGNFGGDPNNVTVFGESSGAQNSLSMMISPEASGLFHKVIAQSGGIGTTAMKIGQNYIEDGGHFQSGREVVNKLLIDDSKVPDRDAGIVWQNKMTDEEITTYLYSKSSIKIMSMYNGGYGGMLSWPQFLRDGMVFPDADPYELLADSAKYNEVPVMVGTNRDEMKLFMILNPEFVEIVSGIPIGAKGVAYYELYSRYHSAAKKADIVDRLASLLADTPGQPEVFAYRFDWDEEPTILGVNMSLLLGAGHGTEIAFAFADFNQCIVPTLASVIHTPSNLSGRLELSDSMSSYWTEFAYSGSPGRGRNGTGVVWTEWDNTTGNDKYIIFDTSDGGGIRMSPDMIAMSDVKDQLVSEKGFTTQEQHCTTYFELFVGTDLWEQEEYEDLGTEGCLDKDDDVLIYY